MDAIETTESLWDNYAASLAASGYDPRTKDLLAWLVATAKQDAQANRRDCGVFPLHAFQTLL